MDFAFQHAPHLVDNETNPDYYGNDNGEQKDIFGDDVGIQNSEPEDPSIPEP